MKPKSFKKALYSTYKSIAESIMPTLSSTNDFRKTGKLTPEEFVQAGDFLIHKFPMWTWKPSDTHSYLPAKKQFLELKHIPIGQCAECIESITKEGDILWSVVTNKDSVEEIEDIYYDIELGEIVEEDDEAILSDTNQSSIHLYTITITYDNYHRTPRIWFMGYSSDGYPLSFSTMTDDISKDHSQITATIETHPHRNIQQISVHPCRHSEMMKRMFEIEETNNITNCKVSIDTYFIYFLKFMGCMIPRLEFDYTC